MARFWRKRRDMSEPFRLVTRHLELLDFVEEDLEAVYAFRSDPECVEYRAEEVETLEETATWLRETMASNAEVPRVSYNLAIVLKENGQLIGHIGIGLLSCPAGPREYAVGYV